MLHLPCRAFRKSEASNKQTESLLRSGSKATPLRGDIVDARQIHQGEDGTIEQGEDFGNVSGSQLRMIFAEGGIASPMAAILNGPMRSDEGSER